MADYEGLHRLIGHIEERLWAITTEQPTRESLVRRAAEIATLREELLCHPVVIALQNREPTTPTFRRIWHRPKFLERLHRKS